MSWLTGNHFAQIKQKQHKIQLYEYLHAHQKVRIAEMALIP